MSVNLIDYITIASTGNAVDFGDLIGNTEQTGGVMSPTRGVITGGSASGQITQVHHNFATQQEIQQEFGDLQDKSHRMVRCSM